MWEAKYHDDLELITKEKYGKSGQQSVRRVLLLIAEKIGIKMAQLLALLGLFLHILNMKCLSSLWVVPMRLRRVDIILSRLMSSSKSNN